MAKPEFYSFSNSLKSEAFEVEFKVQEAPDTSLSKKLIIQAKSLAHL